MSSRRIIIYGDIHGCLDELVALRTQIQAKSEDLEICVGDIMTRGPKSLEALRYIKDENILSIRGNNDDMFLRLRDELIKEKDEELAERYTLEYSILKLMSTEDFTIIEEMPFYYKIKNLTVIHGGIQPDMSLDEANGDELQLLTRISYLDDSHKYVKPRDRDKQVRHWSDVYDGREGFIVYGHHVFKEAKLEKYSLGIDTGCVFGKKLTAAIFDMSNDVIDISGHVLISQPAFDTHFKSIKPFKKS